MKIFDIPLRRNESQHDFLGLAPTIVETRTKS